MHRKIHRVGVVPKGKRQARLRIEINQEDVPAQFRERDTEAGNSSCLCDAALLVRDGENPAHERQFRKPPSPLQPY